MKGVRDVAFCFRTVKVGMAARMNTKRGGRMGICAVGIFLPAVLFKFSAGWLLRLISARNHFACFST